MKSLSSLFILASIMLVLVLKLAFTGKEKLLFVFLRIYSYSDAAALINEEGMIESSASDENDASLRSRKDTGISATHQLIPSPLRRHHLKFGVLGKRYSYGYLGKRTDGMIFLL
jgi:hypothetical protein